MKYCPYCGAEYDDQMMVCTIDRSPLEERREDEKEGKKTEKKSWGEMVDDLFSTGECHGEKFIIICNALAGINAQCSEYTFGIDRAAEIRIRGSTVCLILGDVGSIGFAGERSAHGGWCLRKNVYALAATEGEVSWMVANPDLFTPACTKGQFRVFLADVNAIWCGEQKDRTV